MPPSYESLKHHLNTPACEGFMKALADCNEENKFMRFLGTCEGHSSALTKCLLEQKELKRPRLKRPTIGDSPKDN